MKSLMSSCLTSTSLRSGFTARICPVSSYCRGGGAWRHAIVISATAAITTDEALMCLTLPNDLGGHVRLQLCRMEGQLLSGHAAGGEDAPVLRGAIFNRRDQLHLLSHADREDR